MPRNPLWDDLAGQRPHPGYLGGMLDAQPILLREANVVAFVTNVRAYPDGLLFQVVLEQAFDDGTLSRRGPFASEPDVAVSVEFADGSSWSTTRFASRSMIRDSPPRVDPHRVTGRLVELGRSRSGGDGGASWASEYWLPVLPPPGPVVFHVELPNRMGRGTIEGEAIRTAADKAIDLWS